MDHHRANLSASELRAWADALAERQAQLDALQADFERQVAEFEKRAERFVDDNTATLAEALRTVRRWFPQGIVIEPWRPSDSTIH